MADPWEQFPDVKSDSDPWAQFADHGSLSPADMEADKIVAAERANGGWLQSVDDTIRNLARGTPVGSWMDEGAALGNAGINKITGGRFGEPYEKGVAHQRATDRAIDAESTKVGELPLIGDVTTGGLTKFAGGVGSAFVAPAVNLFKGASMLPKLGNAAVTGATYGGVYGSGEGEGIDRAGNAALGAGVGGFLGPLALGAAKGLGNAAGYLTRKPVPQPLQGFERGAVDRASRAAEADGLFEPGAQFYARQTASLGDEGMLADMGPNLRGQAKGIATQPGVGQQTIKGAMEARHAGASTRIKTDTNAALGFAEDVAAILDQINAAGSKAAKPLYDKFRATPIKPTEKLVGILDRAKAAGAYDEAQKLMAVDGISPPGPGDTADFLDLIKRGIDAKAYSEKGGSDIQRRLKNLSRELRDEVDSILSPINPKNSIWAKAREVGGDTIRTREALDAGEAAFSKGLTPDQMARDIQRFSPNERKAYRIGAREQIRNIMGNSATAFGANGDSAARRALGSEFAREKLGMVSRPNKADDLIRRLEAETTFAKSRAETYQGTETAARQAAQKEFPGPTDATDVNQALGARTAVGLVLEGSHRIANALVGGAINERRVKIASDAARMLVAQGSKRDEIAKALFDYARSAQLSGQAREAVATVARSLLEGSRQQAISTQTNP